MKLENNAWHYKNRKKWMENSLKCHWTLKNVHTFRAEPFISVKKPIVAFLGRCEAHTMLLKANSLLSRWLKGRIGEEDIIVLKGKKTKTNKVIRTVYIAVWTRSLSLPWPDPNYQDLVILNKICQFASSFGILESLQNHLVLDGVKSISGTHGSKRVN